MILRKKLESILLVDDDEAAIFLHSTIIQMLDCTEKILVAENGEEAIKLLSEKQDGEYLKPSLIFLDINMPRMNGWEFLETYKRFDPKQKAEVIVVMLTTSLNPSDKQRALKTDEVNGFMNKPITMESLKETLRSYFADFVQP